MSEFPEFNWPLDKWIDALVAWLTQGWRFEFFRSIGSGVLWPLVRIEQFMLWLPPGVTILVLALLAWRASEKGRDRRELAIVLTEAALMAFGVTSLTFAQTRNHLMLMNLSHVMMGLSVAIILFFWIRAGRRPGLPELAIGGLVFIGIMGLWEEAMRTLAVVGIAALLAILLSVPTGIVMAKSDRLAAIIRPLLDAAQTMPSFVYLVPAIMLFGLGKVPAVIATVIYAIPPGIRLTNLGIRLVPDEMIEAAQAFGVTQRQLLYKVQLPLALPTIMTGVNQVIMAALAMVVIASLVGTAGLGNVVLNGISRLKVGMSFTGGISIVILAVIMDRVTRRLGSRGRQGNDRSAAI